MVENVRSENAGTPEFMPNVPIDDLLLDRENPRLAPYDVETFSQEQLLRILWKEMEVHEIALSIARNGWFKHEHVLAIPAEATEWASEDEGKWVVVEGNRRLVAVRVLSDPNLINVLGGDRLVAALKQGPGAPTHLPVVPFPDRKQLWAYIGFEHVNGAKPWQAMSKAHYVWKVHTEYGEELDDIAEAIGDTHSTVERLFRGYAVLRQAEDEGVFTRGQERQRDFYFSHLYTALSYQQFKDYLGIDESEGLSQHPVPHERIGQLKDVFLWLYGDDNRDIDPVIERQYPDLNDLREVVGNSEAAAELRETGNLEGAYVVAVGRSKMFMQAVADADNSLQYATSLVSAMREHPERLEEVLERMANSIKLIREWFDLAQEAATSSDNGMEDD